MLHACRMLTSLPLPRHCVDARVYGLKTTATENDEPPPVTAPAPEIFSHTVYMNMATEVLYETRLASLFSSVESQSRRRLPIFFAGLELLHVSLSGHAPPP